MSDNSEKSLITFIKESPPNALEVLTIDNVQIIPEYCFNVQFDDILHFFKYIPTFIKNYVKAVILQLFDFKHPNYRNNVKFRLMIATELEKRGIRFQYINFLDLQNISLLIAAGIEVKVDESILLVKVAAGKVLVNELHRSEDGYKSPFLKGVRIVECPVGYNSNSVKDDVLASCNPKKIILAEISSKSSPLFNDLKNNILKSKKLIAFENLDMKYHFQALLEIAERIFDERYNKFYIYPESFYETFWVENEEKLREHSNMIGLYWSITDGLPFSKTAIVPRSYKPYYVAVSPERKTETSSIVYHQTLLLGQYHKIKLTLTIDTNFLPYLTQEPYIDPLIEKLPLKLTETMSSLKRIPIIGFFDNSSIIYLWNQKENGYKFCKTWNGIYGKDLFIAFDKEKPTFFDEARKSLETNPSFVVYDFVKILSDIGDILPDWKFDILHKFDENNYDEDVLTIICDGYGGKRIGASPEILMGRLLYEHIKAIKKETKIEPKELGFVFFDKNCHEKCRFYFKLERRMKKICEMVGIDYRIIEI